MITDAFFKKQTKQKENDNVKNDWIKEMTIKQMNNNVFHLVLNSDNVGTHFGRARCGWLFQQRLQYQGRVGEQSFVLLQRT